MYKERQQWPMTEHDWKNLWNIRPLPIKLEKIQYTVNEQEKVFASISLAFQAQNFESYQVCTKNTEDQVVIPEDEMDSCHVKMRKNVHTIKIKQRNTPEGVTKICGLWLLA